MAVGEFGTSNRPQAYRRMPSEILGAPFQHCSSKQPGSESSSKAISALDSLSCHIKAMKSSLWTKADSERRYFIGGSDARIIMGDDEAALLCLWREKRGEIEPADLSGNLLVQLGLATEALNRRWYEANSGQVISTSLPRLNGNSGAASRRVSLLASLASSRRNRGLKRFGSSI
jgi:hypothetical protein